MNRSYLSLGSNIGNRLSMLQQAIALLNTHPAVDVEGISSIYETEPVGFTDQENFLNMVTVIRTSLAPLQLLTLCQTIEQQLQRRRIVRWGPRTIDLDILLYNQDNMKTEKLTIPHPQMHVRAFVLVPLLEMEPNIQDPRNGQFFKGSMENVTGIVRVYRAYPNLAVFLNIEE